MCGRYFFQMEEGASYFFKDDLHQEMLPLFQQGEVFPSQNALVLWNAQGQVLPTVMQWGMMMYQGKRLINARMEGMESKPMFRPLLKNRCAIVANGFFEWQKIGTHKQKIYIRKKNQALMYLAGLYNPDHAFVIVTGSAEDEMAQIHNRAPIIMDEIGMRDYLALRQDFVVDNQFMCYDKV